MKTYREFSPSQFDTKGLGLTDRQDYLVVPVFRNRDSDCLAESNFRVALRMLGGKSDTVEVHRFGHWANGWFEIILIAPRSAAVSIAERIETLLADYPVLDENDFSDEEVRTANGVWSSYRRCERIAYIRNNRQQFEFKSLSHLMSCVRGKCFAGNPSEFLMDL